MVVFQTHRSGRREMKVLVYKFGYLLFKLLIRPFKRTPVRWSAIVLDEAGRFAVAHDSGRGRSLPSGEVRPGRPIPELCRGALGLDQFPSTAAVPLRLVGIDGRGCEQLTLYYAAEIASGTAFAQRFGLSFVERSQLGAFVPAEIARKFS
jgi:hypothetical protein